MNQSGLASERATFWKIATCPALLLALILTCLADVKAAETRDGNEDVVAAFKHFIESPPHIKQLIYRRKLPPVVGKEPPKDVGLQYSTNYEYWHLRWMPNAFSHRIIKNSSSFDPLSASDRCVFRYGDNYCDLDGGTRAMQWTHTTGESFQNPVATVIDERVREAGEVLNLGVFNLAPGSITWRSNKFEAKSPYVQNQCVSGELIFDQKGPRQMNLEYKRPTGYARYTIRYHFNKPLALSYVPNEMTTYLVRDHDEIEMSQLTIEDVTISQTALDRALFDPEPIVAKQGSTVLVYTNAALHLRLPDLTLERILEPKESMNRYIHSKSGKSNRVLFCTLVGLVNAVLFALLLRVIGKQQTKKGLKTVCAQK